MYFLPLWPWVYIRASPNHLLLWITSWLISLQVSLILLGWFQGHKFSAQFSQMPCKGCLSEERLQIPWTGKKQLAVSAVNVCANSANPSSSHQQSTRNTSRTLKNEVEPVWSYGAFEWLLFPTFPSHDIHMISWSVPGFSSLMHNSSRHLQHHHWAPHCPAYFGVAVQIQSKEEWICNILKPKLQPPVLADVCKTHLIRRSCSEIIGYQTVSRWSLKNWQKMATWPWNSTFTEDYTWNITINRSSLTVTTKLYAF